jgi:hypothetical protein
MPYKLCAAQQFVGLRRLPENDIPDCAGFLLAFKARKPAHSELCNGFRNAEGGQKSKQEGMSFDRNRLSPEFGRSRLR